MNGIGSDTPTGGGLHKEEELTNTTSPIQVDVKKNRGLLLKLET